MGVFRSEEMYLCQVFIPVESAYSIMAVLGEHQIVEFRDLNEQSLKDSRFVNEVSLCENLEGKLHYLRLQTKDYNIKLKKFWGDPVAPHPRQMIDTMTPGTADFDLLRKLYNEVKQISYNLSPLERTVELHLEYQAILKTACNLLFQKVTSLSDPELGKDFNVHVIGGVLPKSKWNGFERTLWRLCHGNYVLQVSDIPSNDPDNIRRLFVILAHGLTIKEKILKLCLSYSADMYDIPESRSKCSELSKRNKSIIADLKKTVATSKEHYTKLLSMAASNLSRWLIEIKKMKSIYHNMNKFKLDETETFLMAECWVPKDSYAYFVDILQFQAKKIGGIKPMVFVMHYNNERPPTHFTLNKFTRSFQAIINAYGIANYKELNPMPYTIITFPFLFAVMFGDIGHGFILALIASTLIITENKCKGIKSEVFQMIFSGRYIILLMGIFAMYTGLIYNDVFSYFLWTSPKWSLSDETIEKARNLKIGEYYSLEPSNEYEGVPCPHGLDPTWRIAHNDININNSLKMKISIIFGVVHMTFGLWLSLFNMRYFKDHVSIYSEFIPQMLFFLGLFGYFAALIFIKWVRYGPDAPEGRRSHCAPSIIIEFVGMVLFKKKEENGECENVYPGQTTVQTVIMVLALACVPVILITKPAIAVITKTHPQERNQLKSSLYPMPDDPNVKLLARHSTDSDKSSEKEKGGTGEMIIHQVIHTIEFCLGTVSYTASYLRLWALSLAHTNLSSVLNSMVFSKGLGLSENLPAFVGGIVVAVTFIFWAFLTMAILIIMEGLSAFLHALRLHWMEFQSKFYVGTGYPFTPFSLKDVIKDAETELE